MGMGAIYALIQGIVWTAFSPEFSELWWAAGKGVWFYSTASCTWIRKLQSELRTSSILDALGNFCLTVCFWNRTRCLLAFSKPLLFFFCWMNIQFKLQPKSCSSWFFRGRLSRSVHLCASAQNYLLHCFNLVFASIPLFWDGVLLWNMSTAFSAVCSFYSERHF